MPGVVLYTGTEPGFPHHLHIKVRPLGNSLRFQQLIFALKISHLFIKLCEYRLSRKLQLFLRNHVMGSREDRNVSQLRLHFAGKRIDLRNPLHLVPEELHPVSVSARVSRINLQHITSYAETASLKIHIISCILDVDKLVNYLVPVFFHPRPQGNYHLLIIDRTSQTINTMITSSRSDNAAVAEWRSLSISSLMAESFSMYVSVEGT